MAKFKASKKWYEKALKEEGEHNISAGPEGYRLDPNGKLSFRRYQEESRLTAIYPGRKSEVKIKGVVIRPGLDYVCKGLCGEVGEIMEHLKKVTRDEKGYISTEKRFLLFKEVGDVLWYLSQLCDELKMDMEAAAIGNIFKLQARAKKGTIKGSGDQR